MTPPALVVAGDQDHAFHLNVVGSTWQADAFHLSPNRKSLLTVHGGEHSRGGITGLDSAGTTDEHLPRAALVMEMTAAYLRSQLGTDGSAWAHARGLLTGARAALATVQEKD